MGKAGLGLLLALVPAGALAAPDSPPLTHNDPSAVVAKPADASRPITPPAAPAAPAEDQTPRFALTSVAFDGVKAIPEGRLAPAWSAYQGKQVSLADLGAIARAAEAIYARAGYPFVAVVLNPQRVVGGAVRFTVIEGHVSNLTVLGADPTARRQATAAFAPLVDKTPLPASAVEEAYEHAQDIPGLTIAGAFHRGTVPGGMDLLVQAKREPWFVYANVNNLYPDAVGPWGALGGVDYRGGSSFGSETSAEVYESLDGGRQTIVRVSYERGLNASGAAITASLLADWADPGRDVAVLDLATNVVTGRLAYTQPIFSSLSRSLVASAAFEFDDQKTRVFSSVDLTDDHLRLAVFDLVGAWRFPGGAHLEMTGEVRQGLEILGASRAGDISLSRAGADPAATVAKFSGEALSPALLHGVRFDLRVDGQVASGPLTAAEQYEVGNLTIGRGYQPAAAFGDDALGAAAEVRFGPFNVLHRLSVEPFGFYDRVKVWTLTPGARTDRTLSSYGGGLRIDTQSHLHVDLTYAVPETPPLAFGVPTPHAVLLVNITMGLSDLWGSLHHPLTPEGPR